MKLNFSFSIGKKQRSDDSAENTPVKQSLPTLPGQPINVHSTNQALKLAAVYRCMAILSGTIASLPLEIKRKTNGYFTIDEQSELYLLLSRRPNRRMNNYEFIRNMVMQIFGRGNAYIVIRRKFGSHGELILCANDTVTYDKLNDIYLISDPYNRIYGRYEPHDIIHLKNVSSDGGYTGESTITHASRVLSIAASADNQSLRTFQNGSKIKGIISGAKGMAKGLNALGDAQTSDVAERVENDFNSGRDIVSVSEDMEFTQLSISPADAQLLETKKFSVLDICRFFGVHPDKVFAGQSTNYKASEMSNVSFLTDTLQPILRQIEAEFNNKLIPDSVAHIYRISFDRNALYQTDLTTQITYFKGLIETGMQTPNELRLSQGYAPVDGGDIAFMSCNFAPINSAKIRGESKIEKAEQPKTE